MPPTTRADRNNNPAAFTTAVAQAAGLRLGTDYSHGDAFTVELPDGSAMVLYTARLIGDPVALTIQLIDAIGFHTRAGNWRWTYVKMPTFAWHAFTAELKRDFIGWMYFNEGGTELQHLFPNYLIDTLPAGR